MPPPPITTGYDRARSREVGRKNIELTTMEEAFTSEHWIVRIYKVTTDANHTHPSTLSLTHSNTTTSTHHKSHSL